MIRLIVKSYKPSLVPYRGKICRNSGLLLSKIKNDGTINLRYCTTDTDHSSAGKKVGGFAQAFQRYTSLQDIEKPEEKHSFASLFRNSKFIDLGDPEGKIVIGEIFQVVENDLYIDFGWKFHCVCPRPPKNGNDYVRGAKVKLIVKDLELSTRFLGTDTDLTLLEADCKILNLIYSPARKSITQY